MRCGSSFSDDLTVDCTNYLVMDVHHVPIAIVSNGIARMHNFHLIHPIGNPG